MVSMIFLTTVQNNRKDLMATMMSHRPWETGWRQHALLGTFWFGTFWDIIVGLGLFTMIGHFETGIMTTAQQYTISSMMMTTMRTISSPRSKANRCQVVRRPPRSQPSSGGPSGDCLHQEVLLDPSEGHPEATRTSSGPSNRGPLKGTARCCIQTCRRTPVSKTDEPDQSEAAAPQKKVRRTN